MVTLLGICCCMTNYSKARLIKTKQIIISAGPVCRYGSARCLWLRACPEAAVKLWARAVSPLRVQRIGNGLLAGLTPCYMIVPTGLLQYMLLAHPGESSKREGVRAPNKRVIVFYILLTKVIPHHSCCILFIRSKSPSPAILIRRLLPGMRMSMRAF